MKDWRTERDRRRALKELTDRSRVKSFAGYVDLCRLHPDGFAPLIAAYVQRRGNLWITGDAA